MVKLIISLSKTRGTRLKKHLEKEHPITKGKIKLCTKRRLRTIKGKRSLTVRRGKKKKNPITKMGLRAIKSL